MTMLDIPNRRIMVAALAKNDRMIQTFLDWWDSLSTEEKGLHESQALKTLETARDSEDGVMFWMIALGIQVLQDRELQERPGPAPDAPGCP
jgi:hypothetical protein